MNGISPTVNVAVATNENAQHFAIPDENVTDLLMHNAQDAEADNSNNNSILNENSGRSVSNVMQETGKDTLTQNEVRGVKDYATQIDNVVVRHNVDQSNVIDINCCTRF